MQENLRNRYLEDMDQAYGFKVPFDNNPSQAQGKL
jgi:hypothetical protein